MSAAASKPATASTPPMARAAGREPLARRLAPFPDAPIDRIEPLEAMDRIEPAEPMDRIEPADPMDRIDPAEPTERAEPNDSADPTDAADSVEPSERHESTDQAEWDDLTAITFSNPARQRSSLRSSLPSLQTGPAPTTHRSTPAPVVYPRLGSLRGVCGRNRVPSWLQINQDWTRKGWPRGRRLGRPGLKPRRNPKNYR
jgi:hypothetical protein